jgi:hypothetical protein
MEASKITEVWRYIIIVRCEEEGSLFVNEGSQKKQMYDFDDGHSECLLIISLGQVKN